jgi:CTP:molybdopterin cytidylyltransferase MocA
VSGVGCAVLAAGGSTRLGQPKQLLTVEGVPLLRHVVDRVCASQCTRVAVVLGSDASRIALTLDGADCTRLDNPDWREGIASSIRVAARWARETACDALMILACDQLLITTDHVNALCAARTGELPVASAYAAGLGIPALFESSWFSQLDALQGDHGAARLLRTEAAVAVVPWPDGEHDVDTPEDAASLGLKL